jgi:pimeloyl-ACP methyl ester carboxylesterase
MAGNGIHAATPLERAWWRGGVGRLAWLAVLLLVGLVPQSARAAQPPSPSAAVSLDYTRPGQLVPVAGGRRLNLRCMGSGAPTVVLDAGGGRFSSAWRKVQGGMAAFTRVCSYDRAGYGFSDPNDRPTTAANIVDDLRQALATTGVAPPLVLVGHSAGGLYVTLYADLHPSDVVGLVLIDPGFASQAHDDAVIWKANPEALAKQRAQQTRSRATMRDCADRARAGDRGLDAKTCFCVGAPKDQPQVAAYVADYCRQPKQYEGMLAEEAAVTGTIGDATTVSGAQEAAAARPFGALPLIVLTNAKGWSYTDDPELNARLTMAWRAGHVGLVSRSSRGKLVVAQGAGHGIQDDQPQLVIEAVREVVEAARARP